jgi:hypothetical protein
VSNLQLIHPKYIMILAYVGSHYQRGQGWRVFKGNNNRRCEIGASAAETQPHLSRYDIMGDLAYEMHQTFYRHPRSLIIKPWVYPTEADVGRAGYETS